MMLGLSNVLISCISLRRTLLLAIIEELIVEALAKALAAK